MQQIVTLSIAAVLLALSGSIVSAQRQDARELASAVEGEWVTLTGEVERVLPTSVTLDYGIGEIEVEIDGDPWSGDNPLRRGDNVTVAGRVDEDFFRKRTIEASYIYVERLQSYVYASATDEEAGNFAPPGDPESDGNWVALTGVLAAKAEDTLIIDTGAMDVVVDTSTLHYEPGVAIGERISVSGEMDYSALFGSRRLTADVVVSLPDR